MDHELIHLLKTGDTAAFSEIYTRFAPKLYRQAYQVLQNREETKDLVQDIFVALWNKRTEVQIQHLAGYLHIATRNQVIKTIAHRKTTAHYFNWLQTVTEEGMATADYAIRERQLQQVIDNEVNKLPSKMRLVFNLSRKAHLSHKEIAVKLHLSEATVKTQVRNALRTLRSKLEAILYSVLIILYFLF